MFEWLMRVLGLSDAIEQEARELADEMTAQDIDLYESNGMLTAEAADELRRELLGTDGK